MESKSPEMLSMVSSVEFSPNAGSDWSVPLCRSGASVRMVSVLPNMVFFACCWKSSLLTVACPLLMEMPFSLTAFTKAVSNSAHE